MPFKGKQTGFSLIELMVVAAVLVTAGAVAVMNVSSAVRNAHIDTAYETVLMQLRYARQSAIDKRAVCIATFTAPQTLTISQVFNDGTPPQTQVTPLPNDVQFTIVNGIPTTPAGAPDGIGTGAVSIDFNRIGGGGGNTIYFQPDGSAVNAVGQINDGVVYLARPGQLMSSRAITLLGTTGRLKGWRLTAIAGGRVAWR